MTLLPTTSLHHPAESELFDETLSCELALPAEFQPGSGLGRTGSAEAVSLRPAASSWRSALAKVGSARSASSDAASSPSSRLGTSGNTLGVRIGIVARSAAGNRTF